ncbi:MAG: polysaccharide deacetylase family protein [Candidatus Saccharibacteria bacterium]
MRVFYLSRDMLKTLVIGLLLLLAALVAIGLYNNQETFVVTKANSPYYQGTTDQKNIAYTFNVDWGEEYLPDLLKVLDENKIKATFFITGRWAKGHPDLLKEIAAKGHEIGNHGELHRHVKGIDPGTVEKEISGGEVILKGITGKKPALYAPAYGEFDKNIGEVANRLNYKVVMWSLDTIDWQNPDVATIVRRVVPRIHNDAIILMHPTKPTIEALKGMTKQLKDEGYSFLTVSKLINPESKEIKNKK